MNILQSIGRWFCAFLISTTLSAWILLATTQATLLNRDVVKSWLASSGAYDNALGNLVQVSASSTGTSSVIDNIMLKNALNKTFPASYLQTNTDKIIDATYNWLEGKSQAITFSIPVQDKAAEFSANLAAEIEPVLAKLPTCSQTYTGSDATVACIPKGMTASSYAAQLAQPANGSDFLNTALTQTSFGDTAPQMNALPAAVQWTHTLVWLLPAVWLVLGGFYVLLSSDKWRGLSNIGRQATINSALLLVCGIVLWISGPSIDLSNNFGNSDPQQAAVVSSAVNPIAHAIIPGIGKALTLYSGVVFAFGLALWVGTHLWRKRQHHYDATPSAIPPAAIHDQHEEAILPPPTPPTKPIQ